MGISIRDDRTCILASQSGQAIVEYILILVVTVGLVLGAVYQLNGAFKIWANNYFGSYLACLLETGELPSVGGTPGDSGLCNQEFQAFTPLSGRRQIPGAGSGGVAQGGNISGGSREGARSHSGGGGGGGSPGGPAFGSNGSNSGAKSGSGGKSSSDNGSYTGSTSTSNYGGYSSNNARPGQQKERLDNHFAFEDEKASGLKRSPSSSSKANTSEGNSNGKIRQHVKDRSKDAAPPEDQGMTFGNFMKYLIIAAIIIALVVFLGGQMLQVGKSME